MKKHLPNLKKLLQKLEQTHRQYLESKYPQRNIDDTISRFAKSSEESPYPLSLLELQELKKEYLAILEERNTLPKLSIEQIKQTIQNDKRNVFLLACLMEILHRLYKISPYDTQMLSVLIRSLYFNPSYLIYVNRINLWNNRTLGSN